MAEKKARVEEVRNRKLAKRCMGTSLLLVALLGVILWAVPEGRPIAGIPLVIAGRYIERVGHEMLVPSPPVHEPGVFQASVQPAPADMRWLIGLFLLTVPFLMLHYAYLDGWLCGTKEAGECWREQTPYVR